MTIQSPSPKAAYSPPTVITLQPDTAEARLIVYLRRLSLTGKAQTVILRLGDCPLNWLRGVQDGR